MSSWSAVLHTAEGNVYLMCDEFKLLPNLQHIEDGVNFGRSLGVKIIAGIQSIEQLYEIYGEIHWQMHNYQHLVKKQIYLH